MKIRLTLSALLLILVQLINVAGINAQGFDPRSIPVEMQAWWTPAYGHVHTAIKLPFAQEVSGVLTLPVRIVLHDNPGKLHRFNIGDDRNLLYTVEMGDVTCSGTCAYALTATLDTTKMKNGCQELRVKAYVNTPDGKQLINSSGIPVRVNNGGSPSDFNNSCNTRQLIGRGWYTGMDYTNAILIGMPIAPVSGAFTFKARAANPSSHLFVAVDKSHFIPAVDGWQQEDESAGVVLFDKDGDYQKAMDFSIDTTALANGWHTIQARSTKPSGAVSQCVGCPGVTSFPNGTAKFYFFVSN